MKLSQMKNIGKALEDMLILVGIEDSDTLLSLGSVEATKRLGLDDQVCFNKLYALEGAIQDVRWHQLSKEHRQYLKEAYLNRQS